MVTPETSYKTDGPPQGSSSILATNDSIINNNKLSLNQNSSIQYPSIRMLSSYISSKKFFLERNKTALKDYEKFLKISKKKHKILKTRKNNFVEHYFKSPYKNNPKLIIGSYNTKILGNNEGTLNKKYKVNVIGVDEGYINLNKFQKNEFSRILNEQENYNDKDEFLELTDPRIKSKRNLSTTIQENNKLITTNDLFKKKIKKNKKIKMTNFERGVEFISKSGISPNEDEILNERKNKFQKLKESFDEQNYYKYEIKKLENWDFEHLQKEILKKYLSKEKLSQILKKPENSQMKWYIDIKNDKKQLKLMCRNKYLKEFFNKIDKEQTAIYLQNFSINKKGFNFDIFKNPKNEENEIKNESKGGMQIRQIEFYKEVMKEKLKLEEMFHSELTQCAEEVHNSRMKKKKLVVILYEINQKIAEVYQKEEEVKKIYKRNMGKMGEYMDVLYILTRKAMEKKNEKKGGSQKKEIKQKRKFSDKISEKIINAIKSEVTIQENKRKALRRSSILLDTMKSIDLLKEEKKPKFKFNLEKLDLTHFNEKADLFQLKSDLLSQKNEIEKTYNLNMAKIAEEKNDLQYRYKSTKIKIQDNNAYYKKAKSNLDLRVQTLSGYYYQILKNGIDVRRNGLSWVVVKLMELRAYVDSHYFPLFLDEEEINYLLRVGVKIHELSELIKLFQILKEKQKILRDKHINEEVKKEKELQSNSFLNLIKENHNKIGNDYTKFMEDIQIKYENVINICLNETREEANIIKIKDDLKEQILKSKYDDEFELLNSPELYFIPGTLAEFFAKDMRFRLYFDDVYYLNSEINKRKKDIMIEKENELKIFRNKYEIDDTTTIIKEKKGGNKSHIKIKEQIYAALFGNGISL